MLHTLMSTIGFPAKKPVRKSPATAQKNNQGNDAGQGPQTQQTPPTKPSTTAHKQPVNRPVPRAIKPSTANAKVRHDAPPPRPAQRQNRNTVIIPTEEQISELLRSKPQIISNEYLEPAHRQHIAALSNGIILIDKARQFNQETMTGINRLRRHNVVQKAHWAVSITDIQKFYGLNHAEISKEQQATRKRSLSTTQLDFVNNIILDALERKASDIRINVKKTSAQLRYRIGGSYETIRDYPRHDMVDKLTAMYGLMNDVSEGYELTKRVQGVLSREAIPEFGEKLQYIRISIRPAYRDGATFSGRLGTADTSAKTITLTDLDYSKQNAEKCFEAFDQPSGCFLLTGPTGSGKSTTLKASLEHIAIQTREEVAILTSEDPMEYEMGHGIIQMSLPAQADPTKRSSEFTNMISDMLRMDPDIIMIGEIREYASGIQAVTAAQTGHGTFSTLHINEAAGFASRFRAMNIPDYLIFDPTIIRVVIAQRLLPCVCPHCALNYHEAKKAKILQPHDIHNIESYFVGDLAPMLSLLRFRNVDGCKTKFAHDTSEEAEKKKKGCNDGYVKGAGSRTTIAEILQPDSKYMHISQHKGPVEATQYWANELKGISLGEHALYRVISQKSDPRDATKYAGKIFTASKERLEIIIEQSKHAEHENIDYYLKKSSDQSHDENN